MSGTLAGHAPIESDHDDSRMEEDVEARFSKAKTEENGGMGTAGEAILRLNVGGTSYRIRVKSVVKYGPKTLLGRFARMDNEHRKQWADAYFDEEREFFFERVPRWAGLFFLIERDTIWLEKCYV